MHWVVFHSLSWLLPMERVDDWITHHIQEAAAHLRGDKNRRLGEQEALLQGVYCDCGGDQSVALQEFVSREASWAVVACVKVRFTKGYTLYEGVHVCLVGARGNHRPNYLECC